MIHFEHHPGKRSKHSAVAAAAVSAATIATIAAIANDVGSQQWQWQWWGKAMAAKTEAARGQTIINQKVAAKMFKILL